MQNNFFSKANIAILSLFFVVFISFGLHHLGKFHTADEDLWFANPTIGRVHNYWKALLSGDWENTHINDKPGITTAIVSGFGLFFDTEPEKKVIEKGKYYLISNPQINERTAFYFRLPVLLTNAFLILILSFCVYSLTKNIKISLFFSLFVFLSPILLGISQIVNPDSLLWTTTAGALFSFLLFLQKKKWKYLFLATFFSGLALLSKYTTIFLLVYLFFITIAYFLFFSSDKEKNRFQRETQKGFFAYLVFLTGTLFIFALGMPAVFVHPSYLYTGTIGFENSKNINLITDAFGLIFGVLFVDIYFLKSFFLWRVSRFTRQIYPYVFTFLVAALFLLFFATTFNWMLDNLFHLPKIAFDQARGTRFQETSVFKKIFFEIRPLVFTVGTPALLASLLALAVWIFNFRKHSASFLKFSLLSFIVLFYLAVISQKLLVNIRYGIILYPVFLLISAYGAFYFYRFFADRFFFAKNWIFWVILSGLFLSGIISLWLAKPFYFNYTNILLPKKHSVATAWGYGGYEAAQYLNSLPNARNMTAWADYEGFCNFFLGKCIRGSGIKKYEGGTFKNIDYYVVTRRGKQLQAKRWNQIKEAKVIEPNPVWRLFIHNRPNNFIEIYKGKNLPSFEIKNNESR